MSKKSKKRKRKRSSSCSDEEEEKKSKHQDDSKSCKGDHKKQHVNSTESCAGKREKNDSPALKDVPHSARQIKKPVYRLTKPHATDQKPVKKEEESRKTKSATVSSHREHSSSSAKHDTSGKDNTASGSKTVDRGTSKPVYTKHTHTVSQGRGETSEGSKDEKSSHRSASKLKTQLMSPSLVSDTHKEHEVNALKRRPTAVEPHRTRDGRNSIQAREHSKTSDVSKHCVNKAGKELVQKMCHRDDEKTLKVKTYPPKEVKAPSVPPKEPSITSAKPSPSVRSSKMVNNFTPVKENVTFVSHQAAKSTSSLTSPVRFKIPKKGQPRPEGGTCENNNVYPANKNTKTDASNSETSVSKPKQNFEPQYQSTSGITWTKGQEITPSLSGQPPAISATPTKLGNVQNQVVEELHLARSERRLEVNVMQSYGELTCMDIDPPEEAAESHSKQPLQQDLILVLDTNILISHLDYIKKIRSQGLKSLGFPVILIPWVVLQELDSLKHRNSLSGSVGRLAIPAISYICDSLKSREPRLWGQSMQQAAESSNDLNAENNDDRVLQCCLQYQSLYPECALILCTNDKNLCSKALLSGVKALSKNDLEAEASTSSQGFNAQQSVKTFMLPHISPQVSSAIQKRSFTPVQPHSQQRPELSVEKGYKQLSKEENEEEANWDSSCVSDFEDCLHEVLSDVLEVEMKAAFDNLWLEIVYVKPPWSLQDVLECFKKHWIAVFGLIVPRRMLQTVSYLIDFFNSGKKIDCSATKAALREAKEFVQAFGKRSACVPGAISKLENLLNKLQPQVRQLKSHNGNSRESPDLDVIMNEDDDDAEEKQPTSAQVSHKEVWDLFENIWSKVFQTSLQVFKALGFDPHTMQRAQPAGGPPPPQDALLCLHNLSSVVSQLLQAFSSILSSAPGIEEAHTLFTIICSNEIVEVDSRLTAQHLHDCFSQQEYREKLSAGGNCLVELKGALDHCLWTFTSPP
ncbi:transcriptional protein SWT1 [Halichoeres trimaculatus]|uniref:transcriptional protein SWT1 n=1 Tax=Halichoeres trimaculatus TaxID=147232 RepID=UPI003D9F4C82